MAMSIQLWTHEWDLETLQPFGDEKKGRGNDRFIDRMNGEG